MYKYNLFVPCVLICKYIEMYFSKSRAYNLDPYNELLSQN